MKTRLTPVVALLALVLVAGCASDPKERFVQADRRLGIAADAAKAAFDSKALDGNPAAIRSIQLALIEANAFMARAKPLALEGKDPSFDDYLDHIEAATARVFAALATDPPKDTR